MTISLVDRFKVRVILERLYYTVVGNATVSHWDSVYLST